MKIIFLILLMASSRVVCCGLAWDDTTERVQIASEKSLIVWDEDSKQQHFFRSVDFRGAGRSSGFIVPVPSLPQVADASDNLFTKIENAIEAERPTEYSFGARYGYQKGWPAAPGNKLDSAGIAAAPGGVTVVSEYTLADYDVKVIEAVSIDPLNAWLTENKFTMRSTLSEWLDTYIQKKWYFVVFVFRPSSSESFSTKTVRISFKTERPIYPYKEPKDEQPHTARELKLYFLSTTQYEPEISTQEKASWAGPIYSLKLNTSISDIESLNTKSQWLTAWSDQTLTGQRRYEDLFFNKSAEAVQILPAAKVVDVLPFVLIAGITLLLIGIVAVLIWICRKLLRARGSHSKIRN